MRLCRRSACRLDPLACFQLLSLRCWLRKRPFLSRDRLLVPRLRVLPHCETIRSLRRVAKRHRNQKQNRTHLTRRRLSQRHLLHRKTASNCKGCVLRPQPYPYPLARKASEAKNQALESQLAQLEESLAESNRQRKGLRSANTRHKNTTAKLHKELAAAKKKPKAAQSWLPRSKSQLQSVPLPYPTLPFAGFTAASLERGKEFLHSAFGGPEKTEKSLIAVLAKFPGVRKHYTTQGANDHAARVNQQQKYCPSLPWVVSGVG